jgi:hypothetical protein
MFPFAAHKRNRASLLSGATSQAIIPRSTSRPVVHCGRLCLVARRYPFVFRPARPCFFALGLPSSTSVFSTTVMPNGSVMAVIDYALRVSRNRDLGTFRSVASLLADDLVPTVVKE